MTLVERGLIFMYLYTKLKWAKNEVDLAIEREKKLCNENDPGSDEWIYTALCYESALRALESLYGDGHSGFSINMTKTILNALIDDKLLTPIEDTDDIWLKGWSGHDVNGDYTAYQCNRYFSLFKYVYESGKVYYTDNNRAVGVDIDKDGNEHFFNSGHYNRIVNDIFPITFPYMPDTKPFKVYSIDFLYDRRHKNQDFDTTAYLYIETPQGLKVAVDRYFKQESNLIKEITREEYEKRYNTYLSRQEKEAN